MNKIQPCISVLVPIYNVEQYLDECLSSLLTQSFRDFEVICINDGSTDSSRAIVQRYVETDSRFRVIDKANSGYGASMNQGLDEARGKYIAILESDDFFLSDALETMYLAAESTGSEVVKANFYLYWSTPGERRELFQVVDKLQAGSTINPIEDPAVFFRKPSIWSALYSKSFLCNNSIRFLESPGASYQDAGFNFKVWASAMSVTFLAEPVLCYRQDNEASSVKSSSKMFCICEEYASMDDYVNEIGVHKKRLYGILERMKFDSYMWNYRRLDSTLQMSFIERAAREFAQDLDAGKVDFTFFEASAKADLLELVKNPNHFAEERRRLQGASTLGKLKHYFALGGISLVIDIVSDKVCKRSIRRTDRRGASI